VATTERSQRRAVNSGLSAIREESTTRFSDCWRGPPSSPHADSRHIHHQLLDFGLTQPQTCLLFYGATALLGSIGLMLFGHQRIWIVMIVLLVVGLSTVAGERLQDVTRRLPVPGFRRLLPAPDGE